MLKEVLLYIQGNTLLHNRIFVFSGNYKRKMLFAIMNYVNEYINPNNTTRNWLHDDKWKCENVRLGLYSHL